MSSRFNTLRHGSLDDAMAVADGDIPLSEGEVRALLFNLVQRVRQLEAELVIERDKLARLAKAQPKRPQGHTLVGDRRHGIR